MPMSVLFYIWSNVLLPRLAAAQMTYGGDMNSRTLLIALIEASRSLCLSMPEDCSTVAAAAAASGSSTPAEIEAHLGPELFLRDPHLQQPYESDVAMAAAAAAAEMWEQNAAAAAAADKKTPVGTENSLITPHEDARCSSGPNATVVGYKWLYKHDSSSASISSASTANATRAGKQHMNVPKGLGGQHLQHPREVQIPKQVIKIVAQAKRDIFGSGGEAWKQQGMFQLLHNLMVAARQNWENGYSGEVIGFGTSMHHFTLCKVEISGVVEVDDSGKIVWFREWHNQQPSSQQQQQQQQPAEQQQHSQPQQAQQQLETDVNTDQLLAGALARIKRLYGCTDVQQLEPGEYLVGKYTYTQVLSFLPIPLAFVYPAAPAPGQYTIGLEAYAAIQGLLLTCAGPQAATWTQKDVDDRIQQWQKRQTDAKAAALMPFTDEMWSTFQPINYEPPGLRR